MRALICCVLFLPGAAFADVIVAESRVVQVTLFPQGAEVTRQVEFDAGPGEHQVVVPGLPGFDAEKLRVSGQGLEFGAISVGWPEPGDPVPAERAAALAEVAARETTLREAQVRRDAIRDAMEPEEAKIAFLKAIRPGASEADAEALAGVAGMIGREVGLARQAVRAAEAGLAEAEAAVERAQSDLEDAQSRAERAFVGLRATVEVSGGAGQFSLTYQVYDANWSPVYDLVLDRKAGRLHLGRGLLVNQDTGEDWAGVALTLSTAEPLDDPSPGYLLSDPRRVVEPGKREAEEDGAGGVVEPIMDDLRSYSGDTVEYSIPGAVTVPKGTVDLRLPKDALNFRAEVLAVAVPREENTAFLVASMINDSGEILLPGPVNLFRDGTLFGRDNFPTLPPGAEAEFGFGPIKAIRLTRHDPRRMEGERGILTSSTEVEEQAVLGVENLTEEAWKVRLLDRVPYSEQEELELTWTAEPAPNAQDVEGRRGILAWEFEIAPGETREVALTSVMTWPEGKEMVCELTWLCR